MPHYITRSPLSSSFSSFLPVPCGDCLALGALAPVADYRGFRRKRVSRRAQACYRHIDTARKYGTERAVGEAMRSSFSGRRDDIFLRQRVATENLRAGDFAKSGRLRLAALKVDYVEPSADHMAESDHSLGRDHAVAGQPSGTGSAPQSSGRNFNVALLDQAIVALPRAVGRLQAK